LLVRERQEVQEMPPRRRFEVEVTDCKVLGDLPTSDPVEHGNDDSASRAPSVIRNAINSIAAWLSAKCPPARTPRLAQHIITGRISIGKRTDAPDIPPSVNMSAQADTAYPIGAQAPSEGIDSIAINQQPVGSTDFGSPGGGIDAKP
jgi:hypothetical protein